METFSALLTLYEGIHWSPVDSLHKCQWPGALMFSLICAWTKGSANNWDAGDLRRHSSHYDVTVMRPAIWSVRQVRDCDFTIYINILWPFIGKLHCVYLRHHVTKVAKCCRHYSYTICFALSNIYSTGFVLEVKQVKHTKCEQATICQHLKQMLGAQHFLQSPTFHPPPPPHTHTHTHTHTHKGPTKCRKRFDIMTSWWHIFLAHN